MNDLSISHHLAETSFMRRDELHTIFKKYLTSSDYQQAEVDEIIYHTVGDYISRLMSRGNIPHYLLDQIEADLNEEVLEMYRKTTYGYSSLQEYRKKALR